jgi:predicted O-methyltransferase YrrM
LTIRHRLRISAFNGLQHVGLHLTPNHFYEPVPDTRAISDSYWNQKSEMPGIDMNEPGQLELLARFSEYKTEYGTLELSRSFGSVDAEVLYSMVRSFKPSQIIEIGSGHSTSITVQATKRSALPSTLTCIEPYAEFPMEGVAKLIREQVQAVPLQEFQTLRENDILFIDSSHVLKEASDVMYEYLEILPRLNKGVIVHIHDVFLPFPYPRAWVADDLRFWNEQYLLQAFLAFNKAFEVLWAGSWMAVNHCDNLKSAFQSFTEKSRPGSFWIRKTH